MQDDVDVATTDVSLVVKRDVTAADVFCYHYDVRTEGNVDPHKVGFSDVD